MSSSKSRPYATNLGMIGLTLLGLLTAAAVSPATARAALDSERSGTDRSGNTMTVQIWDTFLDGVSPMDANRLSREWFHSGRAAYSVTGPEAEAFAGTLELGYQIGFPWSVGVGVNFSYTTPNVSLYDANLTNEPLTASVITPNLLPGVTISSDIGNGPGVQETATFSVDVSGGGGVVAVSGAHGTVTGAAGGVLLRPYARLIWPDHAEVTTYGEQWNMN